MKRPRKTFLQSWVVVRQECDLEGIVGKGSHFGKEIEVRFLGRIFCRLVWFSWETFQSPQTELVYFCFLGNMWRIYIPVCLYAMYCYCFLRICLLHERECSGTFLVTIWCMKLRTSFKSDRTGAAIYWSCNIGNHLAAQSRCSEHFWMTT